MAQTKEFSILKWIVFPSLTLALAGVIAYFNVRVFGVEDGAPYVVVVGVLTAFSIAINKYISSSNIALARATFVFEIILTLALALNAAYSFSVQREMSIARQSETARSEDLKTIKGLKSRTAQRDATRMIATNSASAQQVFADNERPLFWIMVAELLAYIISAFTLLALSHLWQPKRPRQAAYDEYRALHAGHWGETDPDHPRYQKPVDDEFPSSLESASYATESKARKPSFLSLQDKATIATGVATGDRVAALNALREHLKAIAFYLPGRWFKADLIEGGGVWIRLCERQQGREVTIAKTKQSDKLLQSVNRPDFRARLIDELVHQGFLIYKTSRNVKAEGLP